MPSIRVKHTSHSSVRERDILDNAPHALATIFNQNPVPPTPRPQSQRSMPVTQANTEDIPIRPRLRAETFSRVGSYCTRRHTRPSVLLRDRAHFLSGTLMSGTHANTGSSTDLITMEGLQADIFLPNDGESGLIGGALNLPGPEGTVDGSQEHHDDIVEHLDVIGTGTELSRVARLTISFSRCTSSNCIQSYKCCERHSHVKFSSDVIPL